MDSRARWLRRVAPTIATIVAVTLISAGCSSSGKSSNNTQTTTRTASNSKTARGFDGATVTVAGFGIQAQLPGAEYGARARIAKFNETNELPGVKLKYAEFADDKSDPATALSEARRLVTEDKVFAIVGDVSRNNPGAYFKQQHVPYFGFAFDNTYCSTTPDKTLWGFGYNGCLVPTAPKVLPDPYKKFYNYVTRKSGKSHPTVASFSSDTASGHSAATHSGTELAGNGFDVVYNKGSVPPPPVTDYTPYVQQLLTADRGKAPDAVVCLLAIDCISMYAGLAAAGFNGYFLSNLYSNQILRAMKGSYASVTFTPFDTPTAGLTDIKKYMAEVKPNYAVDIGVVAAWNSTDMFIEALKSAAKSGGISPENVQSKAATQTWEIKGFAGPTTYPDATVRPTPACGALTYDDGTAWRTVTPYSCSNKGWPVG